MPEKKTIAHKRYLMYAIGFVFNLSYAIPTYINSSFMAQFTGEKLVGIIYTASSILAIAAFIETNKILRRFGNFKTTMGLLLLEALSILGLVMGGNKLAVISAFILNFVSISLVNFTFDIFLEEFSNDKRTGKIRGAFLSIANSAWLIAPLFVSYILGGETYSKIYLVSGLILFPVLLLVLLGLRKVKEPVYSELSFWKSFAAVWADRDIKAVLFVQFLEQFFYAWMVIYMPIYLHETIGFDWPVIHAHTVRIHRGAARLAG
jgi:MFS family permease